MAAIHDLSLDGPLWDPSPISASTTHACPVLIILQISPFSFLFYFVLLTLEAVSTQFLTFTTYSMISKLSLHNFICWNFYFINCSNCFIFLYSQLHCALQLKSYPGILNYVFHVFFLKQVEIFYFNYLV